MAVISPGKRWPDHRVPYVADSAEIVAWLQEVNTVIGFELLVERRDSDPDYVLAEKSDYGVSETLGYIKSHGPHKINGKDRFTMQHELFHTLGFHHEQLHAKGPWGAFGRKAKGKANLDDNLMTAWGRNMVPEASRIPTASAKLAKAAVAPSVIRGTATDSTPTSRVRSSSYSGGDVILSASNEQAIEAHKNAYQAAQDDNNIVHFGDDCDFDSLMMYSEMRNSAKKLGLKMAKTGRTAEAPEISNGDVAALKYLYSGSNVLAPASGANSNAGHASSSSTSTLGSPTK